MAAEKRRGFGVQDEGYQLSANSGWLGLSEAKPRS